MSLFLQWHNEIALRFDVLGCYLPAPHHPEATEPTVQSTVAVTEAATPATPAATTPLPAYCNPCPDVPPELLNRGSCACPSDLLWDGIECVLPSKCPCFVGGTRYQVGSVHEAADCSLCVCRLGGVVDCRDAPCPACPAGLRSSVSGLPHCKCLCQECPERTRLCPSSNACLNDTLWCNGVQDCPDDELNCPTTPGNQTTFRM